MGRREKLRVYRWEILNESEFKNLFKEIAQKDFSEVVFQLMYKDLSENIRNNHFNRFLIVTNFSRHNLSLEVRYTQENNKIGIPIWKWSSGFIK